VRTLIDSRKLPRQYLSLSLAYFVGYLSSPFSLLWGAVKEAIQSCLNAAQKSEELFLEFFDQLAFCNWKLFQGSEHQEEDVEVAGGKEDELGRLLKDDLDCGVNEIDDVTWFSNLFQALISSIKCCNVYQTTLLSFFR